MGRHSMHFAVGTKVVRRNVRGFILGFSKTTGVKDLRVSWEDGTVSDIPNPRYPYIKWDTYRKTS